MPENRTLYALLPTGAHPSWSSKTGFSREQPVQKFDARPTACACWSRKITACPFVEFRAVFSGGVLAETRPTAASPSSWARCSLKGTPRRSAEDIAREIESVGGSIDSYGGNNSFGVNAEVLSADFATGLDLRPTSCCIPISPPRRWNASARSSWRPSAPKGSPAPERRHGHAPRLCSA